MHITVGVGTFSGWLVLLVAPASSGLSLSRSRWVARSLWASDPRGQDVRQRNCAKNHIAALRC